MLIKVTELEFDSRYNPEKRDYDWFAVEHIDLYINPERVVWLKLRPTDRPEYALMRIANHNCWLSLEDGQRIIDHINGTGDGFAPTEEIITQGLIEMIADANKSAAKLPYEALPYVSQYHAPEQPIVTLDSFKAMIRDEHFVVLDTETTGLERGEIVQIAIVDKAGNVILNTLVKPVEPIPPDATRIHGITDDMVKDAPTWEQVRRDVFYAIAGRHCIVYNAVYDRKMMHQSAERRGMVKLDWKDYAAFWCAMEMFAAVYGDWNDYRGNYRWQKLSTAAARYGIEQSAAHTALDDAETTRQLCLAMAAE